MVPAKDTEGILEFRMQELEKKIENIEDKIDEILSKVNSLNCPVHNFKIEQFEKRLDKIEDRKHEPKTTDTKYISDVMTIVVKAVITIVAAIFGMKQF